MAELDGHTPMTADEQAAWDAMQADTEFDPATAPPADPGGESGTGDGSDSAAGAGDQTGGAGSDAPPAGNNGAQPPAGEQRTEADDEADGVETVTDQRTGKKQQRVSFHKFQRMQKAYEDSQRALQDLTTRSAAEQARITERLNIINEALSTPAQQPGGDPEPEADPEPDPEKDIFEYVKWQGRRIEEAHSTIRDLRNNVTSREEGERLQGTYQRHAVQFAQTEPNFAGAYVYLIRQREAELLANGVPADDVTAQIAREEQGLVKKALAKGVNAAEHIFTLAKARGFQPLTAEQLAAARRQQNGNGAAAPAAAPPAKDPNALDAGGAPRGSVPAVKQNGAANGSPAPAAGKPNVQEIIENIKKGQEASLSLSNVGGAVPPTLTPELLGNMSEEDFNRLVDNLPEARLRELLGD